jgi:hypothetical protein
MKPMTSSQEKILNITTRLWDKLNLLECIPDACVIFTNGEKMNVHLEVLKQLNFFRAILADCGEVKNFEMKNDCINKITFGYLYEKLVKRFCYVNDRKIMNKPQDQLNYIKTLDHLTDLIERDGLLDDIEFQDMFWIGIVSMSLQNIETFFTSNQLQAGYDKCLNILRRDQNNSISNEDRDYLKNFFKIKMFFLPESIKDITFGFQS